MTQSTLGQLSTDCQSSVGLVSMKYSSRCLLSVNQDIDRGLIEGQSKVSLDTQLQMPSEHMIWELVISYSGQQVTQYNILGTVNNTTVGMSEDNIYTRQILPTGNLFYNFILTLINYCTCNIHVCIYFQGNTYGIWKLSDLGPNTANECVVLFLFGDVYKEHWKTTEGSVVALLNASLLPAKEVNNNNKAIIMIIIK